MKVLRIQPKKYIWTKVGKFLGRAIALTLILCAWAIIIAFTLKVLWFIWFRILL